MSQSVFGADTIIDLSKLRDMDIVAFSSALMDSVPEITERINGTVRELLSSKGEVPGHAPAFASDPDFLKSAPKYRSRWYGSLWEKLCREKSKGSAISMFMPISSYLYNCYGMSASKLLLGCEMETRLPTWLERVIEASNDLSAREYDELWAILDAGKTICCDAPYLLKNRLQELAVSRGTTSKVLLIYPGIIPTDIRTISTFSDTQFPEPNNPYVLIKPHLGNHKLFRLICCICKLYEVSPDYLLLQDYSAFAVTERGRYYAPATRKLISRLLTVDQDTKAKAVGFIMAHLVDEMKNGKKLPESGKKAESMGSIDTIALTDTSIVRRSMEAELLAAIREKILEEVGRSNEPVSTARILSLIGGHSRITRKALTQLEEEGVLERLPQARKAANWRLKGKTQN